MSTEGIQEPLTEAQTKKVHTPTDKWTDSFAARVTIEDFRVAEGYRSQNHDLRWRSAEQLYVAYVAKKTWRGTRIPRASLGSFLVFQQIQSFLPRALSATFAGDPWFESTAMHGTPVEAARTSQDVLIAQLEQCNIWKQTQYVDQSALLYGNGIMGLEWFHKDVKRKRPVVQFDAKRQRVPDILGGNPLEALVGGPQQQGAMMPTGEFTRRVVDRTVREVENRPRVFYQPIKDFFIDPNCPSSDPKDARYVTTRHYMAIDDVLALTGKPGFKVPPINLLLDMAMSKGVSEADTAKMWSEVARGGSWEPRNDYTSDPGGKRVEVLRRWSDDRLVWVVRWGSGAWPLYNVPNPFGFIPFYNVCYADMLDRFYGMAMSDVLEGEQRFQQGLRNARIDELALSIHTPTAHKRGLNVPASQLRQVPGALIPSQDPKGDIVRLFPQGATANAFVEDQASELRAQKITGLNDAAISGVGGMNNPTGRTATGAAGQIQAAFARIQFFVENQEVSILEPVLRDAHILNGLFLDPNQIVQATDGRDIDPVIVFGADVKFKMRASSRMASKLGLLQVYPTVLQSLMNPMLLQQLARGGKTADLEEAVRVLLDASGFTGRAEIFRDLTEEELQGLQERTPAPEETKLQMQRERMDDIEELQGQKFSQDTVQKLLIQTLKNIGKVQEVSTKESLTA